MTIKNKKNIENPEINHHLNYLLKLAVKYNNKTHLKKFIEMAEANQVKLGTIKRMICFECHLVLILNDTMELVHEKRENGVGVLSRCLSCKNEKFYVFRGCKK